MSRNADPLLLAAFARDAVRPFLAVHIGYKEPLTVWAGTHPFTAAGHTFQPAKFLAVGDIASTLDHSQQTLTIDTDQLSFEDCEPPESEGSNQHVFNYTGSDQIFTALKDEIITIKCKGGDGANSGGVGGYSEMQLPVKKGDTFSIVVGHGGETSAPYGFGGRGPRSGGGLSGVFRGSGAVQSSDRARAVCVAGGGGASDGDLMVAPAGSDGNNDGATGNLFGVTKSMRGDDSVSRTRTLSTPGNINTIQPAPIIIHGTGVPPAGALGGKLVYLPPPPPPPNTAPNFTSVTEITQGGSGGGYYGGQSRRSFGQGGSGFIAPDAINGRMTTSRGLRGWNNTAHGRVEITATGKPVPFDAPVKVWLGAFNDDFTALEGAPLLIFSGTVESAEGEISAENGGVMRITAKAGESLKKANTGERYNHGTQSRLFPGDRGLEFVGAVHNQRITWGVS